MLRPWKISLAERVDRRRSIPVYQQIVQALIHDIQRGRLLPGTFLPSSRELATTLGVNRKTIVIAYDDLIAQGWLASDGTRGTIVSSSLPELAPRPAPILQPDIGPEALGARIQDPSRGGSAPRFRREHATDLRRRRAGCAAVVAGRAVARLPHGVAAGRARQSGSAMAIRAARQSCARPSPIC